MSEETSQPAAQTVQRDADSLRDPIVRSLATAIWRKRKLKEKRDGGAIVLPQEVVYLGLLAQSLQAQLDQLDAFRYTRIPTLSWSIAVPWDDGPEGTAAAQAFLDECAAGPPRDVTEADLQGWLQIDRERLIRLSQVATPRHPELHQAEIDMVQATINQLEAELRYMALQKQYEAAAAGKA